MAYQLSELNQRVRDDAPAFLAEADARFQKQVEQAADRIIANLTASPIVLLSGPSGSGKTTSALKIEQELERRGIHSHAISMDDYFRNVSPETTPRTADGAYDLESPLCMDMDLLDEQFTRLSAGEEVLVPHYDFARQMRDTSRCRPLRLGKNEIAIFEGIHALNDDVAGRHPEAFKVYLSARSSVMDGQETVFKGTWMRLTRRAVRDMNFRGSDVETTLSLWANVRRGEKLYISPYKYRADLIFDSALPYEVGVMRKFALPLFQAVPEDNPRRAELLDMIRAFERFEPVDDALVSPDSLLREFIGGGSYSYG